MRAPNLFTRDDTFFGVCEALGQDFGFNPLPLRVALGVLLLWNPAVVVGTYLATGLVIAAVRWFYPARAKAAGQELVAPLQGENDREAVELAAAA